MSFIVFSLSSLCHTASLTFSLLHIHNNTHPLYPSLPSGPSTTISYDAFLRLNVRLDLIMDEMEVLKEGSAENEDIEDEGQCL